jgi:hypothetical protein
VKPTRSAKQTVTSRAPGQRARLALGGVDGLGAHGLAQVQAGHVLEHRADHRHEAGDAVGVAARQLGLAEAGLEHQLERRGAQRLGRLGHPAPDHAHDRELLLLADPGLQEGAGDPGRFDVGVRAHDGVDVRHRHPLRAAQGHEELGRHADPLADLARRVARLATHRALGADEQQAPVAAGSVQIGELDALGGELLEELQARLARAALEPVEQTLGGEVGPHRSQA